MVSGVDIDELWFRILWRVAGQPRLAHVMARPARWHRSVESDDGEIPGRCLRQYTCRSAALFTVVFVDLLTAERAADAQRFVAFVLDGDRGEASIGADPERVRLAARRKGVHDRARNEIDNCEVAAGSRERRARIDGGEGVAVVKDVDRRRLVTGREPQFAAGLRIRRIRDVDEPDFPHGCIRIDQRPAVRRGGDDSETVAPLVVPLFR